MHQDRQGFKEVQVQSKYQKTRVLREKQRHYLGWPSSCGPWSFKNNGFNQLDYAVTPHNSTKCPGPVMGALTGGWLCSMREVFDWSLVFSTTYALILSAKRRAFLSASKFEREYLQHELIILASCLWAWEMKRIANFQMGNPSLLFWRLEITNTFCLTQDTFLRSWLSLTFLRYC